MPRGLTHDDLKAKWQMLPKTWYAIYQWGHSTGEAYTEWIAEWILETVHQIELDLVGLRNRSFRADDHRGQIDSRKKPEELTNKPTEKRLVRAMFNSAQIPLMDQVIDYQVPLKDFRSAGHGEIDLLCASPQAIFVVEAKEPGSGESILKAVLEAYVYMSLVSARRQLFLSSFNLDPKLLLTPVVLTFANALSGRQLKKIGNYPQLLKLVGMLNTRLATESIAPIRFFVVENTDAELTDCLTITTATNGDLKPVFRDGFTLSLTEHCLPPE